MTCKKQLYTIVILFLIPLFSACSTTPAIEIMPTETPSCDSFAEATPSIAPAVSEESPEVLPVPVFSHEAGFYDNYFSLTLSSAADTEIYYTIDGTDPRTSKTAYRYTQEIEIYNNTDEPNRYSSVKDISLNSYTPPKYNIDKGMYIRASVKTADGTYGPVITNSYFIGKTAPYYSDIRVISMVTDADYLFHPDTGAYMVGTGYYEWKKNNQHQKLNPSDVENPTNYNADGRASEFPVNIQVFENGISVYSSDVGARISGNWSRSNVQKSFRFYARSEYGDTKMRYAFIEDLPNSKGKELKKYDKVTLRSGGNDSVLHFRDAFIHDLASESGIDCMASEPYILFINGEFWGMYLLREKPDSYYIQSHYGIDESNVSVLKNGGLESGSIRAMGAYVEFCRWASTADMTVEENYQKFCEQMDVQSFMNYIAIETYVCNSDWASGYFNNWMVWRSDTVDPDNPKADGKWRYILYDLDISCGLYGNTNTSYHFDCLGNIGVKSQDYNLPNILRNLCKNQEFSDTFYNNYLSVIENCFAIEKVEVLLDKYTTSYKEATVATHKRFSNNQAVYNYDREVKNLLNFFKKRPEYAKQYLDSFCGKDNP